MTIDASQALKKTQAAAWAIRENNRLRRESGNPSQYEGSWEATARELDDVAAFLGSIIDGKEVEENA